jgi:hypothetical protein
MTVNKRFEVYKIQREIKRSGQRYEFFRYVKNEFGEPTRETVYVEFIDGLYHEINIFIPLVMTSTTQTRKNAGGRSVKQPAILCLWNHVKNIGLTVGDFVKINDKVFKITGVINVQEWNLIADVCLELVDFGFNFSV